MSNLSNLNNIAPELYFEQRMETDELDKIHYAERTLLQAAISICSKHHIPYYLIEGTLLGAVRHKGFIPWDDDVDIAIPINFLSDFSSYAKKELDPQFYIETAFSEIIRESPDMTRIFDKNFRIISASECNVNLFVDVFVLVGMPKNPIIRRIHYWRILLRRIMVRISCPDIIGTYYWSNQKAMRKFVIKVIKKLNIGKVLPFKSQIQKLKKCLSKYPFEKSKFVMAYPSAYGNKEIFPKAYYGSGVEGKFEGYTVRLPDENHKILTALYGDYMQLPPEEKRKPTHVLHFIND